jgi:cyclopropane-fatty-acyl-phospholipid synthase
MIGDRVRPRSPARAASILRQVFGTVTSSFAFRLWDGTEVPVGTGEPRFTVVIHSPQTFARLIREPTPFNFAHAFVESAIDIEGDLFAAMEVADVIEALKLPLALRLRILASLWAA